MPPLPIGGATPPVAARCLILTLRSATLAALHQRHHVLSLDLPLL